jgi:type 1 fimbria pilin
MTRFFSLLFFIMSFIGASSHASCVTNYAAANASPRVVSTTQAPIVVQRDIPIGSVIGTITLPAESGNYLYCTNGGNIYYESSLFQTKSPQGNNTFATNIPGVGIDMMSTYWDYPAGHWTAPNETKAYYSNSRTFSLVKTGAITSGVISSGVLVRQWGDDKTVAYTGNLTGGSITQLACSLSTTALNFPIGDVLSANFGNSVGTIPTNAENTQNLGLNCDEGANINITLQGTQNPDISTTSVLALTGQGNSDVAKGVGVQLLYNGTPLVLNNRIVLKKSAGGQETFPITARYYQTKTSVTTGKANASATLDLTYQ